MATETGARLTRRPLRYTIVAALLTLAAVAFLLTAMSALDPRRVQADPSAAGALVAVAALSVVVGVSGAVAAFGLLRGSFGLGLGLTTLLLLGLPALGLLSTLGAGLGGLSPRQAGGVIGAEASRIVVGALLVAYLWRPAARRWFGR